MKINVKPVEKQLQFREIVYNILNKFINGQSSRKTVTQNYRACKMAASCRIIRIGSHTMANAAVCVFLCNRKFRWNLLLHKSPTGQDRTAAERRMSLDATRCRRRILLCRIHSYIDGVE